MFKRHKLISVLAVALLIFGIARAASLVLHTPAAGYANQYDMAHRSACLGFWPVTEGARTTATPAAPIPRYYFDEASPQECMFGSEVVIAGVALALPRMLAAPTADIRWLGGGKLILLGLIALYLHRELRGNTAARILHAGVFAVLLCDPFNTLFFNTLYTEASAVLGAYLALGALLAASVLKGWPPRLIAAWLLGLLLLGFSRKAHMLLPALLALPAYFVIDANRRKLWAATIAAALFVIAVQAKGLQKFPAHADANIVNTVFATMLTATPTPDVMNNQLGLPQECARLANASWYRNRGMNLKDACPEAFALSRVDIVGALLAQPRAAAHLFFRSLHQSGGWRLPYIGEVAGKSYQRVEGVAGISIATWVAAMPFALYTAFYLGPLLAGVFSLAALVLRRRHILHAGQSALDATPTLLVGLLAVSVIAGAVYAVALVGDGYAEFSRHVHLAHNLSVAAWCLLAAIVVAGVYRRQRSVLIWLLCLALLPIVLQQWVARMPLGSGMLATPVKQFADKTQVEISGWVADPNGVAQVTLESSTGQSWLLNTVVAEATAQYFPVGAPPVEFRQTIDLSSATAGEELCLHVQSSTGQSTLIDRRWVQ